METSKTHILDLPRDVIIHFALQLDIPELLNLCMTTTRFSNIICKNKYFWQNYRYGYFANVWTPEKAEKARKDFGYLIVDPKLRGILHLSVLSQRYKRTNENLVYVPALRAVGERSFLRRYFTQVKDFSEEEIDRYLAESFTIDNYQTTMKERYDEEIRNYQAHVKQEQERKRNERRQARQ